MTGCSPGAYDGAGERRYVRAGRKRRFQTAIHRVFLPILLRLENVVPRKQSRHIKLWAVGMFDNQERKVVAHVKRSSALKTREQVVWGTDQPQINVACGSRAFQTKF